MQVDAILIDDNPWIRSEWQDSGHKYAKQFVVIATRAELEHTLLRCPSHVPIFIDVELGEGESGVDLAADLARQGWTHLFLSTAHPADDFLSLPYIKGVVDKRPPTWLLEQAKPSKKLSNDERKLLLAQMTASQRAAFDQRIVAFENAVYGCDGSLWLDGVGVNYPDSVLDVWERAIYESRSEVETIKLIQAEWSLALGW